VVVNFSIIIPLFNTNNSINTSEQRIANYYVYTIRQLDC